MRVIVTRPQHEAQQWVHDLSVLGLDAQALPLIQVGPVADPSALVQAWQRLGEYLAVMFVSGNAVAHFFASKPVLADVFSSQYAIKTRAWAPGPATARALLRAGVPAQCIDVPASDAGQFDSEALWQVVGQQVGAGDRVLIVRGGDPAGSSDAAPGAGRAWLAQRLVSAGARPEFVLAYQRSAPDFSPQERQLACQAASDGSVWLFSSAQAVANLSAWLPGQSWSQARALVTHPRISAAAKKAGFCVVCESRPALPDVVAALNLVGQTAA